MTEDGEEGRDRADLSFGGWRDWLLVVVGAPLFVVILVAVVRFALANRRGGAGAIHVSFVEAVVIAAAAIVSGSLFFALRRRWNR